MISIIICSINNNLFEQISASIKSTVGTATEIIKINNLKNSYSISEAYNIGAKEAKFPYVCFVHEDVLFKSNNWGNKLIDFFESEENVGLVGVAGSKYKSLTPSIWAQRLHQTDYYNILQRSEPTKKAELQLYKHQCGDADNVEVKTLDGVFLFTEKRIWENNQFDEILFRNFHCYDLDFCLQVGGSFKLFVTFEVLIEHFSMGNLGKEWAEDSIKLSRKWANILPVGNLTKSESAEIEWNNKKIFFYRMNILKYPMIKILQQFCSWGYFKTFSFRKNLSFLLELSSKKIASTAKRS